MFPSKTAWLIEMSGALAVGGFGLVQCGAAKYVDGVTVLGEQSVREGLDSSGLPIAHSIENAAVH